VFDVGFFPWWGWDYPYYSYDNYYPYSYSDPGYSYDYGSGDDYGYDDNQPYESSQIYDSAEPEQVEPNQDAQEPAYYYDSSNQTIDSSIATIQGRLAREGYYKGKVDGVLGPSTRYALVGYQSSKGLQITGTLTQETLQSLGAQRVARE